MTIRHVTIGRKWRSCGAPTVLVFAASLVLAACGSSSTTSSGSGSGAGTRTTAAATKPQNLSIQGLWVAGDTSLGGVWVAEKKGYFKDANLNVSVKPGGDIDPTQLVLGGSSELGLNAATSLLQAKAKGAPIKIVGCNFQHSPLGIVAQANDGITKFSDLKGKKVGADSISQPLLQAFLEANRLSTSDVKTVTIADGLGQFLAKQVDAQISYINSEPAILHAKGVKDEVFSAADNNFDLPDYCLFAKEDTLKDPAKVAAIAAFMKAAGKGWADVKADPAAAAQIVAGMQKGSSVKQVQGELTQDVEHFVTDPASTEPPFGVTEAQFTKLIGQLKASGFLKQDVTAADILDTSLIPKGQS
jgi:ABC-type nitrate/sulfonate/bicarbonate transport system substrate-binding protein